MFPTASTVGVPAGWSPVRTINGDYVVNQAGAVVQDLRIHGSILIQAPNVTVRRVEVIDGRIENFYRGTCQNGLVIEDSSVRGPISSWLPVIATGGYTARRVLIDGVHEGFRIGGRFDGCGPVVVQDSFARAVFPPAPCEEWHGDALQGYDAGSLTVRNSVLELVIGPGDCGGTAPLWYPSGQGNTSVDVDGLIVIGGGYPFRLGTPGRVVRLHIVDDSWVFGPIDVECSLLSVWDAWIVSLDAAGQPVIVRPQPCNT